MGLSQLSDIRYRRIIEIEKYDNYIYENMFMNEQNKY